MLNSLCCYYPTTPIFFLGGGVSGWVHIGKQIIYRDNGRINNYALYAALLSVSLEMSSLVVFPIPIHCLWFFLYWLSSFQNSFLIQLESHSFGSISDYDHDTMVKKLSKQREENSQLVTQNHKLMTELENMSYELHQAKNKVSNIDYSQYWFWQLKYFNLFTGLQY